MGMTGPAMAGAGDWGAKDNVSLSVAQAPQENELLKLLGERGCLSPPSRAKLQKDEALDFKPLKGPLLSLPGP